MNEKIQEALGFIDEAVALHRPVKLFALYSGGNDSLVNTHVVSQHPAFSGVAHFNTRVGVRRTRQHVIDTCAAMGWPLYIYKTPVRYITLVKRWGFPGPPGHQLMYRRLKDRCVYMLLKEHKTQRLQRIGLCTGLRRSESQKRMGYTNAVQRYRSQVWVNPIFNWTKDDLDEYRAAHNLPIGPVSHEMGMSGECFCGAYAKKGELERLRTVDPVLYRYLRICEAAARAEGHDWGWEDAPPKTKKNARKEIANALDFQPLCASCNVRWEQAQLGGA